MAGGVNDTEGGKVGNYDGYVGEGSHGKRVVTK